MTRSGDEDRSQSSKRRDKERSRDRDRRNGHGHSRSRDDSRSRSQLSSHSRGERYRRSRSRDRKRQDRDRSRSRDRRRHDRSRSRDRHRRSRSSSYDRRRRERNRRHRRSSSRSEESRCSMSGLRTRSNSPGSDDNKTRNKNEKKSTPDRVHPVEETSQEVSRMSESTQNETSSEAVDLSSIYVDGKYIGEVQTEEQRRLVHEQMKKRLEMLSYNAKPQKSTFIPVLLPQITPSITPFVNDGSFLERFKQMQQQYEQQPAGNSAAATTVSAVDKTQTLQIIPKPAPVPMVGRRRGGKILKTGVVEKPKKPTDKAVEAPTDAWALYLREVQRYKSVVCDDDKGRPLVK